MYNIIYFYEMCINFIPVTLFSNTPTTYKFRYIFYLMYKFHVVHVSSFIVVRNKLQYTT
jgi:hypothetical protein